MPLTKVYIGFRVAKVVLFFDAAKLLSENVLSFVIKNACFATCFHKKRL